MQLFRILARKGKVMWFVSPKTAVTCPDPPRRPDLNFDKTGVEMSV